jgi:nucleotide-binding universal stress UspA family protein
MKILLAVDGSDYSNAAVDAVSARPWPKGSVVKILSAIESLFVATPETWALPDIYYRQLEQTAAEQAEMAVREARHRLQAGRGVPLEAVTEIRAGRAQDVILDEAERWGADLIVLGSHGYRAFKRFLLGSVSQAVATHAPCSVEIVRRAVHRDSERPRTK